MRKSQENEELQQQFKHLQEDWDSFKQSNPGRHRRCSSDMKSNANILQLMDTSPRKLISSLQERHSPPESGWKVRNNDLVVEEIVRERRAAIERGKMNGRRLFEALKCASETDLRGGAGMHSGCSSVLIQGSEVRSLCSFSSSSSSSSFDDDEDDHDSYPVGGYCYSSSASSSMSVEKRVEGEKVVLGVVEKNIISSGGGWGVDKKEWMNLIGCLAIVLMIFALGIISLRSLDEDGDQGAETLIPT